MKRLFSILLAFLILVTGISGLLQPVSAESMYIRKIVSVVYDDSGSMEGDKWAYANYAMQAFCGMLNSEDQLFITYMSHAKDNPGYDPEQIDLSAGGIQNSVDAIRKHSDTSSTPYTSVEVAFNKLKSIQDTNVNTQYWLVVITDGVFDESNSMNNNKQKEFLNDSIRGYRGTVMPNGTNPQVTFLGIGGVVTPDDDPGNGIYTYSAESEAEITEKMSLMADRISGRTRLQKNDIVKIDDTTIQVSSAIPLLNIVTFTQGTKAKVKMAVYSNETDIPLTREVSLSYPDYTGLVGSACLLGDSQKVIGTGTYNITFDQPVELEDVIILFEPALEMRMTILVNGQEITDHSQLDNLMEEDVVTVTCKLYEMGTDTEIDPALLPPGTEFELSVSEDGKVTERSTGEEMVISDYALDHVLTEITATVLIEGFNPIVYTESFTPAEYIPKIQYTMTAALSGSTRSIKYDDLAANTELAVVFTVFADGVPLTDPEAVKAMNPVVATAPQGNDGTTTYSGDGQIVFTPNSASTVTNSSGSFDVEVTCTLEDGTKAAESYTVLLSDYLVVPVDTTDTIKKTEFYGNQTGASFYITKDGVQMDKASVETGISALLDEKHQDLEWKAVVSDDGVITIIPYTNEEWELNFFTWWANGWRYLFKLESSDVEVTLNHSLGSAANVIDVTEADIVYILLNVAAPILVELAILAVIIAYIYCVCAKPKFGKNAVLYSGNVYFDPYTNTHEITGMKRTRLAKFNKFKYRAAFTTKSKIISAGGAKISAQKGGSIECYEAGPAFKGNITFKHDPSKQLPGDILRYCKEFGVSFSIEPFLPIDTIARSSVGKMAPTNRTFPTYFIAGAQLPAEGEPFVIQSGKIFVYLTEV